MTNIDTVNQALAPLIQKIRRHPLYDQLYSLAHLRIFMEHHVFVVWDFMCLLKELHRRIVSTQAPWFPPRDAYSARLIHQILVDEEGDLSENGIGYLSHFELYLSAMQKIGANTQPITVFLKKIAEGHNIATVMDEMRFPNTVQQFVQTTFNFFGQDLPFLAAAFVYGREAITPLMFEPLIQRMEHTLPVADRGCLDTLLYYLRRHIELDQNGHFPRSLQMLNRLAGTDVMKWQQIETAAQRALQSRLDFLTSILHSIQTAVR